MTDPSAPASVRLRAATLIIQAVAQADTCAKPVEPRFTTSDVDRIIEAGAAVGEEAMLRQAIPAEAEREPVASAGAQPIEQSPVARNVACPCGSGDKYKRCCGRNAPGAFGQSRAA